MLFMTWICLNFQLKCLTKLKKIGTFLSGGILMLQISPELQKEFLAVVALGDFNKSSNGLKVVPENLLTGVRKIDRQKLDQLRHGFLDLLLRLHAHSEESQAKAIALAEQVVLQIDLMHSFLHGASILMTIWPNLHPDQSVDDFIIRFIRTELRFAKLLFDLGSQHGMTAEHCQQVIATTERGKLVHRLAWTEDLTLDPSSMIDEFHRKYGVGE